MKIVLDTHILIYAAADRLSPGRSQLLRRKDNQLFFSSISLWEISKLSQLGRLHPEGGLEVFLRRIVKHSKYAEVGFSPDILLTMVSIAEKMQKDPADQLVVATALSLGACLMSDDVQTKKSKLIEVL